VYRGDSAVYKLQTHHYYIADSVQQPGTQSLWRYVYPTTDGSAAAQEVVQGVARMLVTYGLDSGTASVVSINRYVTADNVPSWDSVAAMRIQLLMTTVKDGVTLSSQPASFAGATVTPTDKRMRTQVTEVVTLRNRTQ
jgi:type IV pilus assembly protein PilW